jgi:hypothetical protein
MYVLNTIEEHRRSVPSLRGSITPINYLGILPGLNYLFSIQRKLLFLHVNLLDMISLKTLLGYATTKKAMTTILTKNANTRKDIKGITIGAPSRDRNIDDVFLGGIDNDEDFDDSEDDVVVRESQVKSSTNMTNDIVDLKELHGDNDSIANFSDISFEGYDDDNDEDDDDDNDNDNVDDEDEDEDNYDDDDEDKDEASISASRVGQSALDQ